MYHELTVWSRGIIMDKEARDVSSCIAAAARALGYYADNVSDYVDDPDRTNCLVRRYARFGDSPIVDRFVYENPHPDWVVLVEETIIKAVNFLRGTPERGGVVVVNSVRDPHYLLKFLPDEMKAKMAKFVVVDAVGLAEQRERSPWMFVRNLSELALDRMSTEGAEERLAIGMGIAAPLIGALTAVYRRTPHRKPSPIRWPTGTPCCAAPPSTRSWTSPRRTASRPGRSPPRPPPTPHPPPTPRPPTDP